MPAKPRKAPRTPASILSIAVLLGTIALGGYFLVRAGLFAALVAPQQPDQDVPELPNQITSGVSTITGFDKDKQPYKLTAKNVVQDEKNTDLAHLKDLTGTLRKKSGETLNVTANGGKYQSDKKILDLKGNIVLSSKDRYTAYMEKARVTLKDKRLYANVPVIVVYDRGSIRANGMEIRDNGKHVLFFNGVKTRLNADGQTASSKGKTKKGN